MGLSRPLFSFDIMRRAANRSLLSLASLVVAVSIYTLSPTIAFAASCEAAQGTWRNISWDNCTVEITASTLTYTSCTTLSAPITCTNGVISFLSYTGVISSDGSTINWNGGETFYNRISTYCNFAGQTVINGNSVTAYQASSVPYGSTCTSQTRTCTNGALSGSYTYGSCTVTPVANCTLSGNTVNHGSSVTAYQLQSPIESQGQQCLSETRTCNNGTLSGGYPYASCTLVTPELAPVTAAMLVGFALLIGWQVRRHSGLSA